MLYKSWVIIHVRPRRLVELGARESLQIDVVLEPTLTHLSGLFAHDLHTPTVVPQRCHGQERSAGLPPLERNDDDETLGVAARIGREPGSMACRTNFTSADRLRGTPCWWASHSR